MKFLLCVALMASLANAADVSGKWRGAVLNPGGDEVTDLIMTVKQEGDTLTGNIGPSAEDKLEIREGKVSGDEVTFQVAVRNSTMKIRLKTEGAELKGDVTKVNPGGDTETMQLKLKRAE